MRIKGVSEKFIPWLVLFIVPVLMYVAFLGVMPLMEPDEGRYSLIPHEMNVSGDYVSPHLKGVVYFEKPPLLAPLCGTLRLGLYFARL
jgi:4-amino-4-deoxy-L-arabinose transferase-like glycosyltransferase